THGKNQKPNLFPKRRSSDLKIEVDASENTEKYTVEEGDTLSSIANQFDVKVNDIKERNDLSDSLINIGKVIPFFDVIYFYIKLIDWKSTRLNSSHVSISYAV